MWYQRLPSLFTKEGWFALLLSMVGASFIGKIITFAISFILRYFFVLLPFISIFLQLYLHSKEVLISAAYILIISVYSYWGEK